MASASMPAPKESTLQRLHSRPGFLLRRAHQISVAIFECACEDIGLTPAQYSVLSALCDCDGMDQTRLGKLLGFDKVTTLRILYLMEDRGLIQRTRLETDRRTNSLSITPEGLALYRKAQRPVERAFKTLMEPFCESEQAQFIGMLEHLITELDRHARAPLVRVVQKVPASPQIAKMAAPDRSRKGRKLS